MLIYPDPYRDDDDDYDDNSYNDLFEDTNYKSDYDNMWDSKDY